MIPHEMQDKAREGRRSQPWIGGPAAWIVAVLIAVLAVAWGSDWSGLGDIPERNPVVRQ